MRETPAGAPPPPPVVLVEAETVTPEQVQQDCMDMIHKFYTVARWGKLYGAPIEMRTGTRVLDLGTGSGIWVMEMAG